MVLASGDLHGVANIRDKLAAGDDGKLWEEARAGFDANMRASLQAKGSPEAEAEFNRFMSSVASMTDARNMCTSLNASADKQYSSKPLTIKGRTVIPKDFLKSVLANMDAFIKLGDLATKGGAESVSVAWSCMKFVLLAVQADSANCTRWAQAADSISRILLNCKTFARLYSMPNSKCKPSEIADGLLAMLPGIYSSILTFSWAANLQVKHSKFRRLIDQMNPFSDAQNASSGAFQSIVSCDETMQKQSQIAFQEVSHEAFAELLRGQDRLEGILSNGVQEILSQISTIFDPEQADLLRFEKNSKLLEPSSHSAEILHMLLDERVEGTCSWVFDADPYQQWQGAEQNSLLWLRGNTGSGKSTLLSSIVQELESKTRTDHIFVAYYYCLKGSNDDADLRSFRIKQSLVYSLYSQLKEDSRLAMANTVFLRDDSKQAQAGPEETTTTKNSSTLKKKSARGPSSQLPDLDEAIVALSKLLNRPIYFLVDAPDLCSDFEEDLKASFTQWSKVEAAKLKIVVSTRSSADLSDLSVTVQQINVDANNSKDILSKATSELAKIPGLSAAERKLVKDAIMQKANGQFTYVELALALFKRPWKRPIENILAKLSDGMKDMYQQLLKDVDPAYAELARVALQWTLLREDDLPVATLFDIYSGRYLTNTSDSEGPGPSYDEQDSEESNATDDGNSNEKLFKDQISQAVGQFINTVGEKNLLEADNQSVKDCFLRKGESPTRSKPASNSVCIECHQPKTIDESFFVYDEDHLVIATTLLKHLNSAEFRKRHFKKLPVGWLDDTDEDSDSAPSEPVSLEDAPSEPKPPENTPPEPKSPPPTDENGPLMQANPGSKILETSERAIERYVVQVQDRITAIDLPYDGYDSEDELNVDELKKVPLPNEDEAPFTTARYEFLNWISHIETALEVFGEDESKCPQLWKALWDQLNNFISNEEAWLTWLYTLFSSDEDEDRVMISWTPIHFFSQIGFTWAVRHIVSEHPEAVRGLADNGSGFPTLPVMFFCRFEDMNERLDLLDLLLTGLESLDSEVLLDARRRAFLLLMMNDPSPEFLGKLISFYLKHEGSVNFTDATGLNALHYAANHSKRTGIVPLLVEAGVDINAAGVADVRPLYMLLYGGNPTDEILEEYLKHGADPNLETFDSERPLALATASGNLSFVQKLIEYNADVNDLNMSGFSAFHVAAIFQKVEIMEALLEAGAQLNQPSEGDKCTAFQLACCSSTDGSAEFLLQKLKDAPEQYSVEEIDYESRVGKTPLHKACASGQLATAKTLLDLPGAESRIYIKDKRRGRTPLHVSASKGHSNLVELLLRKGASVTMGDKIGKTALDLCGEGWHDKSKADYPATALALIDADPTAAATNRPIMMAAATHGSQQVMERLLQCGANYNFKDDHGWSPLLAAKYHNHEEVVKLLEQAEMQGEQPSRFLHHPQSTNLVTASDNEFEFVMLGYWVALLADRPVPATAKQYYFEVTIREIDQEPSDGHVAIGLATIIGNTIAGWQPGKPWRGISSWAYHGNNGNLARSDQAEPIHKRGYKSFGPGDTLGCAVFVDSGTILFTRNGKSLGVAFEDVKGRVFPAICLYDKAKVSANFGEEPFAWKAANSPEYSRFSE